MSSGSGTTHCPSSGIGLDASRIAQREKCIDAAFRRPDVRQLDSHALSLSYPPLAGGTKAAIVPPSTGMVVPVM